VQRPSAKRDTDEAGTRAASVVACAAPLAMAWHNGVWRPTFRRDTKGVFVKYFR
jgi:hypothetical protein